MKIYSFWSADTTYLTKSSSLKKAAAVGKENMGHYLKTCEYLGEKPGLTGEEMERYFIPEEVERITYKQARHLLKVDDDTLILDEEVREKLNS